MKRLSATPALAVLLLPCLLLGAVSKLRAQAIPAGTAAEATYNPGPTLPSIDGNFQYAISAGELAQSGYYGNQNWTYTTNLSGDVEYISRSVVHPFSVLYSGGVLFSTYAGAPTGFFQNLTVSQGAGRPWMGSGSFGHILLPAAISYDRPVGYTRNWRSRPATCT